jgi:hypothetical protein
MDEAQVKKLIRIELARLFQSDKYLFTRDIQIADGRGIQAGTSVGLTIGTSATQKVGFFGETPVVQQGAIPDPGTGGADADGTCRAAVSAIRTALTNIGITA